MEVVAQTSAGSVRGERLPSGDVDVFRGIPYARPPVGDLRWRAPQAPAPWRGVRDARRFGAAAMQRLAPANSLFSFEANKEAEDCLSLNVWTGTMAGDGARPVIVWLHMGAFQFGSGSAAIYDGASWARAGAVFVSLNFRLGRLGFLAHRELSEESGNSGNYGLLDQVAALEWVRDNIAGFGGDPNCVTIYGVSSGASSVSLLMASPRARGMFHRAIAESGGSFGPIGRSTGLGDYWQTLDAAEASGERWARATGARSLVELRALDDDSIRLANARPIEPGEGAFDALRPIVDGSTLPASTLAIFEAGQQALVPLLVGSALQEEFVVADPDRGAAAYRDQAQLQHGNAAEEFLRLYPGDDDLAASASALRAAGHRLFTWQNWIWATLHARRVPDTYYYRFEQPPPLPAKRYREQTAGRSLGAFHGASLFYSFDALRFRDWPWSGGDKRLAKMMIEAWMHFARTGRPAAEVLPSWPRFDSAAPMVMSLSSASHLQPVPEQATMRFWDRFYAQAGHQHSSAKHNE